MAQIKHRVGIVAQSTDIWKALNEAAGLTGWWSSSATIDTDCYRLGFSGLTELSFSIESIVYEKLLHLRNIEGPGAWKDSELKFHLKESEEQVFVALEHYHAQASDEDFQFFMTKWPIFLVSLKAFVETGKGNPYPNDIKIEAKQ